MNTKGIFLKVLLVIFSLEIDKVVTIINGVAIKLGKPIAQFNSLEFLQIQAIVASFSIWLFIFFSLNINHLNRYLRKSPSKEEGNSEIMLTAIAMGFASALSITADLVKLESVSIIEIFKFILLVGAFFTLFIGPLLKTESKIDSNEKRIREYLYAFSAAAVCYIFGLALHSLFKLFATKPVYGTEELFGFGVYWYIVTLIPVWRKSTVNSGKWVAIYIFMGAGIGAFYGLFLYSGNSFYYKNNLEIAAIFIWAFYGISPILSFLIIRCFKNGFDDWLKISFMNASLIFSFTILLFFISHETLTYKSFITSLITSLGSILTIYLPYHFFSKTLKS